MVRREQFFLSEANELLDKGTLWEFAASTLAWLLVICMQFLYLDLIPGIHFDEAWAANFAHRIASESGFWPLHAQSPYTMPWTHYFAAGFMNFFGFSFFSFRFSQVMLAGIGISLLLLVLRSVGRRRLIHYVPFVLVAFPGVILNQRFAIELTGFHVFCAGLLLFGIRHARSSLWGRVAKVLALIAVVLGVSAHVLFLALPLSLFFYHLWHKKEFTRAYLPQERFWIGGGALLLCPFFLHVLLELPEKGKAIALLTGMVIFAAWVLLRAPLWNRLISWQKYWIWLPVIGGTVFLANAVFFWEGHWVILRQIGIMQSTFFFGTSLVALLFVSVLYGWEHLWKVSDFRVTTQYLLVLCFFLGLIVLKQTPRYYHLSFFPLTIVAITILMQMRAEWRFALMGFFLLHVGVSYSANYILPAVYGHQIDTDLRVLTFKDSSRDFLSKQHLVRYLGSMNCKFESVETPDGRLRESLKFLRHSDWPLAGAEICPAEKIKIELARDVLTRESSSPSSMTGVARLLQNGYYIDLFKEEEEEVWHGKSKARSR